MIPATHSDALLQFLEQVEVNLGRDIEQDETALIADAFYSGADYERVSSNRERQAHYERTSKPSKRKK